MTNFALSLKQAIEELFDGNQRRFSTAAKISGSLVTKLLQGGAVTPTSLESITRILPTDKAIDLCRAAIRDYIPPELHEKINNEESTGSLHAPASSFNQADPTSEEILRKLRILVMKDQEAREWLHKTAQWIFPD
jgi:hypothetical protein